MQVEALQKGFYLQAVEALQKGFYLQAQTQTQDTDTCR
jgi:hypothetical protein